jgi:hypothetical protein
MSCVTDVGDSFSAPVAAAGTGNIELRMDVDYERLLFAYRLPGEAWRRWPQVFDASIVSDEAGPPTLPNFTARSPASAARTARDRPAGGLRLLRVPREGVSTPACPVIVRQKGYERVLTQVAAGAADPGAAGKHPATCRRCS